MLDTIVEARVTRLEDAMVEAWRTIEETDRRLERSFERTDRELDRLSREMRAFKDEMGAFKDEMRAFKDKADQTIAAMNKKWGELSNKMGTMAEDLVAPSIPRILSEVAGCAEDQIEWMAVRVKRRHPVEPRRSQEFDVVAVCRDYVLINETKSSLNAKDVDDFIQVLVEAREFFPEHAGRHFIGAIASLYVDPSVVRHGQNQGVLVLGFGEDLMDVLNDPGFVPREF
jgi:hypothetical protein